jgi:Uma2 family endonuclease
MLMATKTRRWTRADLTSLPDDGNRYEVLDGALLVTPQASVPHQWIAFELATRLNTYVKHYGLGMVVGPGAVVFDDNELQPDILVVPPFAGPIPEKWELLPRASLVVEVLSNSTRRRDLRVKPPGYLGLGIPEYWVIDRFERRALVWTSVRSEPVTFTAELRWTPSDRTPSLVIPLAEILPSGTVAPADPEAD